MSLQTPLMISSPDETYALKHRLWQGCPSLLRTPKGRLYAAWYSGGAGEPDKDNYNLIIRSDDDGWTWSEPLTVWPGESEKHYISIDIQLWLDPQNRMWVFITQRYLLDNMLLTDPGHLATWAFICDDPDADELVFSEPKYIANGFTRTQPTVLSNGDWLLCAYDWCSENYRYSRSKDHGETWERCEAGRKFGIAFDEGMILERKDKTLAYYARTAEKLLAWSVSDDLEGSHWKDGEYIPILSGCSRFFIKRLRSGRVLLIHNDSQLRRTDLCAKLSEDDGKTWPYSLHLDEAQDKAHHVTYPDAVETEDGYIQMLYDCGRSTFKEIRMAQFTEEDIIAGELLDHGSYLRRIISKAPGRPDKDYAEKKQNEREIWSKEVFAKVIPEYLK